MAEAQSKPRRRWFQFGLGTMFLLVTLFALWLAWELNFIHQRQAFLAWVDRKNAEVTNAWFMVNPPRVPPATIPFWRRWRRTGGKVGQAPRRNVGMKGLALFMLGASPIFSPRHFEKQNGPGRAAEVLFRGASRDDKIGNGLSNNGFELVGGERVLVFSRRAMRAVPRDGADLDRGQDLVR
ncbi:MAG: hypothetical protein HYX69_14590 [Planctomycetia bacterium]|nr:hypothetical protein [Planctomycetia bacterium]